MSFRKYDHVERFGTDEVEGIEIGDVLVFPKLDGTNASMWLGDARSSGLDYFVRTASRNRELSLVNDNAGFAAWADSDEDRVLKLLIENPSWNIYGEWLVQHTIKHYRDDVWRKFWVFDVWCRDRHRYIHYDEYEPILKAVGFDVIEPKTRYTSPPSMEQLLVECATNTYLMQDGHVGEGIVVKNYEWVNKYGRQPWAKLVRNEFKEENRRAFGTTEKEGEKSVEGEITEKYVTPTLVEKTLAKIMLEETERRKIIPRLLQTVFYDLVREESWNFIKEFNNPTVDFKKLKNYTIYWVKKHKPELF